MRKEESLLRGWYDSSCLHIRVQTSRPIFDLTKLLHSNDPEDRQLLSTFFHEYVHFLQEVTTVSGAYRLGLMIDFMKESNMKIRNAPGGSFAVPVKLGNTFNAATNLILMRLYSGDGEASYAYYQYYDTENVSVLDRAHKVITVPVYTVFYRTSRMNLETFKFGDVCLKEFVTHSLQEFFFPEINHPDIPYKIAGRIIETECPSLTKDIMLYVALCDACLMDIHPARCFFNTIERIKRSNFNAKTCEEIYHFVYSELRLTDGIKDYNVRSAYKRGANFTKKQIADALKSEVFSPNREWITYIYERAEAIRFKKPIFMTALVEGPGKFSSLFFEIFRIMGAPFFTDENFNGAYVPPDRKTVKDIQPYQLLVFREIERIYKGNRRCKLYEFCKKRSDKDITNANCESAPWLRGQEDELCPLGQLWKTWGLNGKVPDPSFKSA